MWKIVVGFLLVVVGLLCLNGRQVFADVPTMIRIEVVDDEALAVLEMEIRHGSPTSSHYVDIIEVEVNERLDRIDDLEAQTSTIFTYEHDLGSDQYENLRVRAHCNLHGWSSWASLGGASETPFFETPLGIGSIAGVIVVVLFGLFIILKRR